MTGANENRNSLTHFSKCAATHKKPYGEGLTSPRNSDPFAAITEEAKNRCAGNAGKRASTGFAIPPAFP
jgi:hypothetical protein